MMMMMAFLDSRRRRFCCCFQSSLSLLLVRWLLILPLFLGVFQQEESSSSSSFPFFAEAKGGELASVTLEPFTSTPDGFGYRQDFCHRYQDVINSNGTKKFKDALSGLKIHPVIQYGSAFPYFNYDPITGINDEDGGLVANILDFIADRANFTWRDSFGAYTGNDKGVNKTWTEMLKWATDNYDISIDKWAESTERLEMGVAFCDPWFDGSLIMVDRIEPPEESTKVNYGNWTLPFEPAVWWVTLATIFFSCLVYQFLEMLGDERNDRSYLAWFTDNLYLSFINFTQNYSYEPTTVAGRIFGISFSFWTMLIGAAYTANLASLLVERPIPIQKLNSIEEGISRGVSMCTHDKSFSDVYINRVWGQANRIPQPNPEDMYKAVNDGECEILIGTRQAWSAFQGIQEYNPNCNLEWVGRTVHPVDAAFATKAYPGVRCTGLVNEVFNYYLSEMRDEGKFDEEWAKYNSQVSTPNFSCNAAGGDGDDGSNNGDQQRRRRQQEQQQLSATTSIIKTTTTNYDDSNKNSLIFEGDDERKLKGGGGGVAVAASAASNGGGEGDEDVDSLTIKQMAGTFLLHAIGSTIALIVAIYSRHGRGTSAAEKELDDDKKASVEKRLDSVQSSQAELSNQMAMILTRLNEIQHRLDGGGGGGGGDAANGNGYANAARKYDNNNYESSFASTNGTGSITYGKVRSFLTRSSSPNRNRNVSPLRESS